MIQRKSLTDRYIQPQLSALALDALFICVPIWKNPPNLPTSTENRSSSGSSSEASEGRRKERERESHREDVRKRGKSKRSEERKEWRVGGWGGENTRTKEPSETDTEKRECERLSLSAAMW